MNHPRVDPRFSAPDLDGFVAAFESARSADPAADLSAFLPDRHHPLFDAVLCELIRVDLEFGWEQRRPRSLADYQQRFPDFFRNPDHLAAIAFEEYRLRRQAGQSPSAAEYAATFGVDVSGWSKAAPAPPASTAPPGAGLVAAAHSYRQQRRLADSFSADAWCESLGGTSAQFFRDLHQSDPRSADRLAFSLTSMPEVGGTFLGFRLLAELGQGTFGRVFLAEQAALAHRRVVLKVAPDLGGEPQVLAQLQHTHIVPIYSLHRAGPFQAVCMPYLGSHTLADVLRHLSNMPTRPQWGRDLVSTVRGGATAVSVAPPRAPLAHASAAAPTLATFQRVEQLSYVEAVLWLGCCLADGLAHAHERGILHRDLKPANVLLADDGTPMLLDFNLSEDTKVRGSAAGAFVGGTLPYMAPEHLEAWRGAAQPVDARSDLFALGIILYELLAGRSPFPTPDIAPEGPAVLDRLVITMAQQRRTAPPSVRGWNAQVSPAAASIVARCLEPDPSRRYQTAHQLHEDLRRQLDHQPLRYTAEPSWSERLHKWLRRSPRLPVRALAGTTLVLLLLAGTLGVLSEGHRVLSEGHRQAEQELRIQADAYKCHDDFLAEMREAQFELSITGDPSARARGESACRRALDRYRVLQDPDWRTQPRLAYLPADTRCKTMEDIGELLYLLARRATEGSTPSRAQRQQALAWNRLAESCFAADHVPPEILRQQERLLRALGDRSAADHVRAAADAQPLSTSRDYDFHARTFTSACRFREALPFLLKATDLDARNFWAWFRLGTCHDGLGDPARAIGCYNVCVALMPRFYGPYFNRGIDFFNQGNFPQAFADFNRVIEFRPNFADAWVNRALACLRLNRPNDAIADLTQALRLAPSMTRIYFLRARAREQAGDQPGAARDRADGLACEPGDPGSWDARGWERLGRKDLNGALADFNQALAANPLSYSALHNKAHVLTELGRPEEASRALDVLIQTYPDDPRSRAGRGVLHARQGRRAEALRDAEETLQLSRHASHLYQVGCIYALTSRQQADDAPRAFALLFEALRKGFGSEYIASDRDLDSLRRRPEFAQLQALANALESARKAAPRWSEPRP